MQRCQVVPDLGHVARDDDALAQPGGGGQVAIHQRRRLVGRQVPREVIAAAGSA